MSLLIEIKELRTDALRKSERSVTCFVGSATGSGVDGDAVAAAAALSEDDETDVVVAEA